MENFAGRFDIAEMVFLALDLLGGFVALTGDDDQVAFAGQAQGLGDGFAPVGYNGIGLFSRFLDAFLNFAKDGQGVLGARVVRCQDDPIGQFGRGPPHRPSFQPVAVAARAEHHQEAARLEVAGRFQDVA